jgi:hypothetical protein
MQTKPYDFETQRKVGQEGETFLDQWLHPIYKVLDVSGEMFSPEAPIDDYLKVGAFALSGLMFMTEIDPNFGEKMALPDLR